MDSPLCVLLMASPNVGATSIVRILSVTADCSTCGHVLVVTNAVSLESRILVAAGPERMACVMNA